MKIDWKRKLSSRKFWALVVAVGTSILTAAGASEDTTVKVTGMISAVGACVVYMLAEAYTDGSNKRDDGSNKPE